MSDNKVELYKALLEARKEMKPLPKDGDGQRGKYTTIDAIIDCITWPLLNHGIIVIQTPLPPFSDDGVFLVPLRTELIHVDSGQRIINEMCIPAKADVHGVGGAITYLRRYMLPPMLLLGDDSFVDDGDSAMGAASNNRKEKPQIKARPVASGKPQPQSGEFPAPSTSALVHYITAKVPRYANRPNGHHSVKGVLKRMGKGFKMDKAHQLELLDLVARYANLRDSGVDGDAAIDAIFNQGLEV